MRRNCQSQKLKSVTQYESERTSSDSEQVTQRFHSLNYLHKGDRLLKLAHNSASGEKSPVKLERTG